MAFAIAGSGLLLAACSAGSDPAGAPEGASPVPIGTAEPPTQGAPTLANGADADVVYGPQSVRVLSTRGRQPVTLRLLAPPHASFRLRRATGTAVCNVVREVGDQTPPAGAPGNVTSRYIVECHARNARGGVLLTTVSAGAFSYQFEVPVDQAGAAASQ